MSVRGHEDCLQTVNDGGSSQYCFPNSKPGGCLNSAWEDLLDKFDGDDCPEEPLIGIGKEHFLKLRYLSGTNPVPIRYQSDTYLNYKPQIYIS